MTGHGDSGFWDAVEEKLSSLTTRHGADWKANGWSNWAAVTIAEDEAMYGRREVANVPVVPADLMAN